MRVATRLPHAHRAYSREVSVWTAAFAPLLDATGGEDAAAPASPLPFLHTICGEEGVVPPSPLPLLHTICGEEAATPPSPLPLVHAICGEEAATPPSPLPVLHAICGEEAVAPPSPLPYKGRRAALPTTRLKEGDWNGHANPLPARSPCAYRHPPSSTRERDL